MRLSLAELARGTAAWTVLFTALHFACRWLSLRLFSTCRKLSNSEQASRNPSRVSQPPS